MINIQRKFIVGVFCAFGLFLEGQTTLVPIEINSTEIILTYENSNIELLRAHCIDFPCDIEIDDNQKLIHISGLTPAQIFAFEYDYVIDVDTVTVIEYLGTKSLSSGEIKVFFNNPVDASFSNGSLPTSTSFGDVEKAIRDLIKNAKHTIDFAAYNTNVMSIVNELIDAYARGVQVRVITDDETTNSGFNGAIPFNVVRGNIGSGLMHNKFIVVDQLTSLDSWVVTGSMNFTTNQMRTDPNHLIFLQDQTLAKAYTIEFEEMWGSSDKNPNTNLSRFGSNKLDNTPHYFNIGQTPVELYFSPSDKTTSKIADKLKATEKHAQIGMMIFTNWQLRDEVKNMLIRNVDTRMIVEDVSNSQNNINVVINFGGKVATHPQSPIFHHKYAILDEGISGIVPTVITGSHNWTFSAETFNDENTIMINDINIANIFRQEFEARWKEVYTPTSTENLRDQLEVFVGPNPFTDFVSITAHEDVNIKSISIFDVGGKVLMVNDAEQSKYLDLNYLQKGVYFIQIQTDNQLQISKLIKY